MKAETPILQTVNQQLDFLLLKTHIITTKLSDEECFNIFQSIIISYIERGNMSLSMACTKSGIIEILQLLNLERIGVYDRIVEKYSSVIVKMIK